MIDWLLRRLFPCAMFRAESIGYGRAILEVDHAFAGYVGRIDLRPFDFSDPFAPKWLLRRGGRIATSESLFALVVEGADDSEITYAGGGY